MTWTTPDLPLTTEPVPTLFDEWVHTPRGREVAERFIRMSVGLHNRGFKRFGSKAIFERIRWWMRLKAGPEGGDDFKVNNNFTAGLARFAVDRRPVLAEFFELREQKNPEFMPRTVLGMDVG